MLKNISAGLSDFNFLEEESATHSGADAQLLDKHTRPEKVMVHQPR